MKLINFFSLALIVGLTTLNATEMPIQEAKEYINSGRYSSDVKNITNNAYNELKKLTVNEKDIVLFDIDDTMTSHCAFRIQAKEDGLYNDAYFFEYIKQANSPVIPEVLEFYNKVKEHGYTIVLLTGRSEDYLEATQEMLAKNGYTGYSRLILKTKEEKAKYTTAAEYKAQKRLELINEGFAIIASVGDQDCDFEGGNTGIMVKLPNPLFLNK